MSMNVNTKIQNLSSSNYLKSYCLPNKYMIHKKVFSQLEIRDENSLLHLLLYDSTGKRGVSIYLTVDWNILQDTQPYYKNVSSFPA